MNTKKIAQYGLFLALALVLSYLETLLPFFVAVPGVKLGLANIVTILVLYQGGPKQALAFTLLRVLMAGVLFSGISGILYGLAGGCVSVFAMALAKRIPSFSILGVSMSGAVFHNLGQIVVACFVVETANLMYYFPILCISGLVTGVITGFLSFLLMKYQKRYWDI